MKQHDKSNAGMTLTERKALAQRCREVLEWQSTGLLCDGALRRLAETLDDSDDVSIQRAEEATKRDALKLVAALDRVHQNAAPQEGADAEVDLLEVARATGLRQHLHGVSATDARALLERFVAALPSSPRLEDAT